MTDLLQRPIIQRLTSYIQSQQLHKPVLIIEGARQTGKTTAIQMACKPFPHLYIDLEKEKIFREKIDQCTEFSDWENVLRDTYGFTPNTNKILIVDEAQESGRLGSFVRYMKEEWKSQTTILSGSLMSRLFRDGVREPVGRIQRVTIYPYSFKEFLKTHNQDHLVSSIENWHPQKPFDSNRHQHLMDYLQNYLQTGGLPEVVHKHAVQEDWRTHLLQIKIQYEEDFARVFGVDKLSLFQRVFKRVAETIGFPSKKSTIIAPSQKGYHQLDDMLSQIERWRLIHKVLQESYQPSHSTRLIPKRYLFDTGICQLLGGTTRPPITLMSDAPSEVRTPLGGLLENYALCELLQLDVESLNGWRYKTNGSEIDFVIQKKGGFFPVEIKSSLKFKKNFLFPIYNYLNLYGIKKGFLVDLMPGQICQQDQKTIYQIPLYCVSEIERLM